MPLSWSLVPRCSRPPCAAPDTKPTQPAPAHQDAKDKKAAPANPKPERHVEKVVYRVTGLFAPDREADFRAGVADVPHVDLAAVDFDHGEATFAYDPAEAFPGAKPDQIAQRLDQAVRNATGSLFSVKPADDTPHDKLARVEIEVAPIDCRACALALHEILLKQDGVRQVAVDAGRGRLSALIDPAKTDKAALEKALEAEGSATEAAVRGRECAERGLPRARAKVSRDGVLLV